MSELYNSSSAFSQATIALQKPATVVSFSYMAEITIKLYKALLAAGVDEPTASTVSEEVEGRDKAIALLTARVNMVLALNVAMFAGVLVLLLDKLIG